MKNLRRVVIEILQEIEDGAYSNLILDQKLKGIAAKRDRALITELVYGVLRQRNRLDYLIKKLVSRPMAQLELIVILALRVGLYQLIFLDRVPARAAVNETVNAVKSMVNRGAIGLINGLLRNYLRKEEVIEYPRPGEDPLLYLSIRHSHPQWLIKMWLEKFGYDRTLQLCRYNNQPPELTIRRNSLKYSEQALVQAMKSAGIGIEKKMIPGSYRLERINSVRQLTLYQEGGFMVQGPAATLASLLLAPTPGQRILDMAAAPGGKTTHLAELMGNQGEIIALDHHQHKLDLIGNNCQRLGIKIVKMVNYDAREYSPTDRFDLILLDAPCSGLGLVRQKPEIKWNKTRQDIEKMAVLQFQLLEKAVQLVKDNGVILYCTCTLTEQENQGIVESFRLQYRNKVELVDLAGDLKRLGLDESFPARNHRYLELFPPESGTEGFFIAKFKRR